MDKPMKRIFVVLVILLVLPQLALAIRIKDIASFDGVRDNQLIGYGLIVGLNGTGDSDQTKFPVQSLANVLERMGITVNRDDIKVKNVAAVMVTAELPPFSKQGTRVDVLVSSLGDAKSLAGGTLLMTPLKGADGQVYAVAQGGLLTNSFSYGGQAATAQKNHPTAGRIPNGALVERELPNVLADRSQLRLNLHQPDFTTATRIARAVNEQFKAGVASCNDPGSVVISLPDAYQGRVVEFVADMERLEVRPDNPAKVVLNERTGTIVIGENVRIDTVAVSHGNLTLLIKETPRVSQPQPLSRTGETVVVPRTGIKVSEESGGLAVLREGASIGDVVRALNALGVTPRDLIGILQAIKAAGAMQAELSVI
ncbi:flagellar basal body P-ring protein FlgI [Geobacter sulfurreducens]|uniref:Flagellar P-ring protein n=1 Tax=Geobacter sulfurreducens (strain ATCC 51573 / DSM 12127 / PCA) TaxID=243231 RepID=FLGI_GEOSL|nr:flagellar basal body P-ring protein FlgI [Geobacter sulfurreducens]Q748F5.1 RecName: Full=Flagellar P-ring protein; AltName: Full=Basal body P-ring protein; Flags: Precursor [Geobacter sulfurreducens PCA]AAR36439.1 flagellar P-ring protein FlgI [Geobacter sulfurreducens PCA]ADI85798.1 flagellar P-ring protein FlgI [Geobacter sulfurreducens KN400]QVW34846.1 flagellar basal body P-ring protein FlgI [Geobacter sulfurreducens]UAC03716.1 flagellar basal body P-ring protein FlgI [Geobacter sulfur